MDKILKFTYQFSLFLLICYGAHAWFTWDYDFYDYRALITPFAVFSAIAAIYKYRFGVKFKDPILLLLIYLTFTIAQSFPKFGYSVPISSFLRLYPVFVLLSDSKHIADHIKFITNALCVVIVPGLIIWAILFFVQFPGYPIQWGDLSKNISYFYFNYGFLLRNLYYEDSIRFHSVFLEPSYLGTLVSFLLYANCYDFKKKTTWILIVALILSFSLAGWIIALIGYILYRVINGLNIKISFAFLLFIVFFYAFATMYNGGDNAINELIFRRLEADKLTVIKGNNRFTNQTEITYEYYLNNNGLLFGQTNEEITSSAGYMVFFIQRGIVSALFFLFFYLFVVAYTNSKRYGFFFILLIVITFVQAAYPDSYAWVIPFVLGTSYYSRQKIVS